MGDYGDQLVSAHADMSGGEQPDNYEPASELESPGGESPAVATQPPKHKAGSSRALIEWVAVVGGALIIALLIKTFLIQAFYIPSKSMVPTLRVGDRVLVNKVSYDMHDIHRGDVVVFKRPPGEAASGIKDLIKRVIGLPGETLEAQDGRVYVDGKLLDEPYVSKDCPNGTDNLPKTTVPAHKVFVMGDNRCDSRDSRYFGAIDEGLIVGRAFVRVWPVTHLGWL
jgi:signal peptidase I